MLNLILAAVCACTCNTDNVVPFVYKPLSMPVWSDAFPAADVYPFDYLFDGVNVVPSRYLNGVPSQHYVEVTY